MYPSLINLLPSLSPSPPPLSLSLSLSPSRPLSLPPPVSRLLSTVPSLQIWTSQKHPPNLASGLIIVLTQCTGLGSLQKKISYRFDSLSLILSLSLSLSLSHSLSPLQFLYYIIYIVHLNTLIPTFYSMHTYVCVHVPTLVHATCTYVRPGFFVLAHFLALHLSLPPFLTSLSYTVCS